MRRKRPPPAPRLFPLAIEPQTAIDLIPETLDPTGRGERAWQILSRLLLIEGQYAGRRIGQHSPPWQRKLTRLIFGHTDEKGLRVLRECFVCMSKKNGKSSYAAAVAITKLLLMEDAGEQIVLLAATRPQAHIIYDLAASTIRADPQLATRFSIIEHRHVIRFGATNSKITAISAEMPATVGANPSLAVIDELHLLGQTPKGAALVGQLRTGRISRKEPLMLSISTAPVDRAAGIFSTTYTRAQRAISGEDNDPAFFAWLCETPAGLDPEDPKNWHWSNPSLGYTLEASRLEAELDAARSDPATLRDFRSQNLNVSPEDSSGVDRWIPLVRWDAAADDTLSLDAVFQESYKLYVGIDRGGLDDLSAIVFLGRTVDDHVLIWSFQWISRQGYEKRKAINDYDSFVSCGELEIFDGGDEDLKQMVELVRQAMATGKLSLTGIDNFGAADTSEDLKAIGADVESVPQNWQQSPAIYWIERLLASGMLKHSGSRLLRWNIGNAHIERRGNAISLTKATVVGSGKVDGCAALLNAAACCISRMDKDQPSVYESRGLVILVMRAIRLKLELAGETVYGIAFPSESELEAFCAARGLETSALSRRRRIIRMSGRLGGHHSTA